MNSQSTTNYVYENNTRESKTYILHDTNKYKFNIDCIKSITKHLSNNICYFLLTIWVNVVIKARWQSEGLWRMRECLKNIWTINILNYNTYEEPEEIRILNSANILWNK